MKSLDMWLEDYGKDHQHPTNQLIHKFCVPAIFSSIVALLELIPHAPTKIAADILIVLIVIGYGRFGYKALALIAIHTYFSKYLARFLFNSIGNTAIWFFVGVFVVAWIGQFWGHKIEGKKPSFLTDLKYLFIGPLWVWMGHKKN